MIQLTHDLTPEQREAMDRDLEARKHRRRIGREQFRVACAIAHADGLSRADMLGEVDRAAPGA